MAKFVDFTSTENNKYVPADLNTQLIDLYTKVAPELSIVLPWATTAGSAYTFNRLADIGSGTTVAADGTITAGTAISSTQVALPIVSYVGTHSIPNRDLRAAGAQGAAVKKDLAVQAGAKQAIYAFQAALVSALATHTGTTATSQAVSYTGSDVFANVDAILAKLHKKQGAFLMGNAAVENVLKKAMRGAGGITTIELNGVYFLAYDGVPFVRNDFISTSTTPSPDTSPLYAVVGDEMDGMCAVEPESGRFTFQEVPVEVGKDAWTSIVTLDAALPIHSLRSVSSTVVPLA